MIEDTVFELRSPVVRIGAYCERAVLRMGASMLESQVAYQIGGALAGDTGDGIYVSTRALAQRCKDREVLPARWYGVRVADLPEVRAPSYGTIVRVLEMLARAGVISWVRAHVRRWHGPTEWQSPRPVRHADGSWRLPVRRFFLVGFARTIRALSTMEARSAPRATSIGTRLAKIADRRGEPLPETENNPKGPRAPVPIEAAPEAENGLTAAARRLGLHWLLE